MIERKTILLSLAVIVAVVFASTYKFGALGTFSRSGLSKAHPEARMSFEEICHHLNYPVETHFATTQDGYILKIFRIQKKSTTIKEGLKPVIFQHGLLDCSDGWILNDEYRAPGFMMANRGYDVWFGNSRGSKHSRNHTKYDPNKDKEFWAFSFDHMAKYDLPAMFSYVNRIANQTVHYVGHSQGTIQMHIALATRNPIVEKLMDKYFALGPVAYVGNTNSRVVSLLDKSLLLQWYELRHLYQFMPSGSWFQTNLGILFCSTFAKVCGDIMTQIMDGDPTLDNYERYDVLLGHDPAGTSVQNMAHWKQMMDHKKFQAYDYGSAKANQEHYGQVYPPMYSISNIRVPIRLFAGSSDLLADVTDVDYMWSLLKPEVKLFYKVYDSGHLTFLQGLNVNPWMNDIFRMMEEN